MNNQNSNQSLKILKAMRVSYNIAKKIRYITIFISIMLPIISIIFKYVNYKQLNIYISTFSTLWIFIMYFFGEIEFYYTKKGAKIQELFDVKVLNLTWNNILIGDKIKWEEILELSKKFKGKLDDLEDWYTGLNSNKEIINILTAQRSNLIWGFSLKKIYLIILISITILYIVLSISIGCFLNMLLLDFLYIIFIPSVPILLHLIKTIIKLHKERDKVNNIIKFIEKERLSIIENENYDKKEVCRQIQDFIYLENRLNSVLIPNFIYKLRREDEEEKMFKTNKKISNQSNK